MPSNVQFFSSQRWLNALGLALTLCIAPARAQATPDPVDLSAPASAVPSPYPHRYDTVVHQMLDDERGIGGVTESMYAVVDDVIDASKAALGTPAVPYRAMNDAQALAVLRKIDDTLVAHGFVYPPYSMGWVDRISDGLRPRSLTVAQRDIVANSEHNERRGAAIRDARRQDFYFVDCDIASFMFLAVADSLDLPLSMTNLPWHNFVHWDFADGHALDFETMDGSKTTDESYVHGGFGLTPESIASGDFLKSMTRAQTRGYHWSVLAGKWEEIPGSGWRELSDAQLAVALYPEADGSWNELAWAFVMSPDPKVRKDTAALMAANRAVSMWPGANNRDTRACVYAELGQWDLATMDETAALSDRLTGMEKDRDGYRIGLNAIAHHQPCYPVRLLTQTPKAKKTTQSRTQ